MKQSISSIWLIGLVFSFILLFSGYLAVTVSYSSAFKLKNEMLTIIEKHDGLTNKQGNKNVASKLHPGQKVEGEFGAIQTIALFLRGSAYNSKGACPNEQGKTWYGVKDLDYTKLNTFEQAQKNTKYYYCFMKDELKYARNTNASNSQKSASYYKVRIFYKMNLPVLGDIFTFRIDGTTSEITVPQDLDTFK